MDWDDLQHFLAIARYGTLSGAARALRVTQSTMSRRLDAMEARLGARLLNKTPGGYVLTPLGEAVLGNVERIESEALAVERTITGKDVRLEGAVRVTTVEALAAVVLMPIFVGVRERYPGIAIDLVADMRTLSLSKREADVAVRTVRPTQHDLVARRAGAIGFGIYASRAYLQERGLPDFAGGAPGHDVIGIEADESTMPDAEWLRGVTGRAAISFRTNDRFVVRAAAEAGFGLACLARFLGDGVPDLTRLDVPAPPLVLDLWIVVHEDTRHMPRIRAVTDILMAELKRRAAALNPV